MTMTKQHFELIAAAVLTNPVVSNEADQIQFAEHFANILENTNPRFNRSQFIKAATIG